MRRLLLSSLFVLLAAGVASAQPLLTTNTSFYSGATTAAAPALANTLDVSQMSTVWIHVLPGSQDTYRIIWEGTLDGTNWDMLVCYPQGSATGATSITTTTASGNIANAAHYRCNVAGLARFRARLSSNTAKTGTGMTIRGQAFQNPFALGGVIY